MDSIIIRQPDDFHLHLRDNEMLASIIGYSAGQFARAMIMPNIQPPALDAQSIEAYRDRILRSLPQNTDFTPLMTLYLTHHTTPAQLKDAVNSPGITAVKYYPAGATTHSEAGVSDFTHCLQVFETMEEIGIPLSIHAEDPAPDIDIFDKEARCIDSILVPLRQRFPKLKIVCEHVSSRALVDFVLTENSFVAATITPHHLLLNRSDLLLGGLNPHHFCLPILKSAEDQRAIIEAAISGNPKFFAGTDSAPHLLSRKQGGIAPAGIFNAPVAMAVYAQVFEDHHALDRLENFCSVYGAHFYTLPLNTKQIRLTRSPWQVPPSIPLPSNESLVPMYAGKTLHWQWEAMT